MASTQTGRLTFIGPIGEKDVLPSAFILGKLELQGERIMSEAEGGTEGSNERLIEEIIAVQREFYFENKNRESDRRRKLREIVERATPLKGR
jgi:hypothetical protein